MIIQSTISARPSETVSTGSSCRLSGVRPMNWLTITRMPTMSSPICTTECMITLIAPSPSPAQA